jgi:HAAS
MPSGSVTRARAPRAGTVARPDRVTRPGAHPPGRGTLVPVAGSELDRYLASLAAALRGPRRARADLLAEVRDGLTDAAEAHRRGGLPAAAAQRRAVADFGTAAELAPAFQAELAVAQGRRTALLIAAGLTGVQVATPVLWWSAAAGPVPAGGYAWLATGFNGLCLAGAALALLVRLGFGWGSRYAPDGVALTRALGRVALGFLALHGLAGTGVYLWRLGQAPVALASPVAWAGIVLLCLGFQYAALCAWRCLSVTRPAAAQPAA